MENLLPIILGLLFVAYKQYQKSNDKNRKTVKHQAETETTSNKKGEIDYLEDAFRQLFGEKEAKMATVNTPNYPEFEPNIKEFNTKEPIVENEPYSIENDESIDLKSRNHRQFEMIQNKEKKTMENIDFDLRKAIIFDAIMNPPYLKN